MNVPLRRLRVLATVCLLACAGGAQATDLMQAWQAASRHDPQAAIAQAALAAGATRREQAASLWRPAVVLSGSAGRASADSSMTGARFSAPGFGASSGATFGTSVENGNSARWSLSARQSLYNLERSAQRDQLNIGADAAGLQWQAARQALMLQTAQRYFDVVMAGHRVALLRRQQAAVERALTEARDRFAIGDVPVTDTHEAAARARGLQAQVLAMDDELQLARALLAESMGTSPAALDVLSPSGDVLPKTLEPLAHWLAQAQADNLELRIQQANVESARHEVRKHGAAAAPTVDLVAQAGRDRLRGGGDFGDAATTQRQVMVAVQIQVPLYTGGWRSAKLEEASRLEDKARAELDQARQHVSQQARAAWMGLQTGTARLSALSEAAAASRSRLDATRLGRQVGDRTTLDLLNAENDAAGADLALLQARVDLLQGRMRLAALAGRLDDAQLQGLNALLQP